MDQANRELSFHYTNLVQLDTIMKELKTLSLALRGMTGTAPGGPPDKGPSTSPLQSFCRAMFNPNRLYKIRIQV